MLTGPKIPPLGSGLEKRDSLGGSHGLIVLSRRKRNATNLACGLLKVHSTLHSNHECDVNPPHQSVLKPIFNLNQSIHPQNILFGNYDTRDIS